MMTILERIEKGKIIAIIRGVELRFMEKTVEALLTGGIDCLEVTYDHSSETGIKNTLESLNMIREKFADRVALGVGTVLTVEEVDKAVSVGAEYIISPNTDIDVIKRAKALGKTSIPGALTPSEIVAAYAAGADIVKLFPAGNLGISYIKALRGPLPHIPMTAVGGVSLENAKSFIDAGLSGVGIGGNLVNTKLIRENDFARITALASAYARAVAG